MEPKNKFSENNFNATIGNTVLGEVLLIRYCGWGGHPCDRWMWESIWEISGIGYNYGSKEYLISDAEKMGFKYKVLKRKRNGDFVVTLKNFA